MKPITPRVYPFFTEQISSKPYVKEGNWSDLPKISPQSPGGAIMYENIVLKGPHIRSRGRNAEGIDIQKYL